LNTAPKVGADSKKEDKSPTNPCRGCATQAEETRFDGEDDNCARDYTHAHVKVALGTMLGGGIARSHTQA